LALIEHAALRHCCIAALLRYNALPMRALRSLNPSAVLAGLGLLTAAFYAGIAYLFPVTSAATATRGYDLEQLSRGREWAAAFYAVGLLLVFGAFAVSFSVVKRVRRPLPLVVGFGLLFALILVWLYPITAIDVFYYVLQGRMQALYGLNPMAVPASQVPLDPLVSFIGEWISVPTAYGPLWSVIAATVVRLGFAGAANGLLAHKFFALATYAACTLVLLWGTARKPQALLLFAWNPLVLLQGPGNAHNDLLMMAVAVLALVLWDRRRWWAAAMVLLALAASIKLPVLLLAPLLLAAILRHEHSWGRRLWVAGASALLGAAAMLVAYIPFWPPWQSMEGLVQMFATQRTYTILSLVRLSLTRLQVPPPYNFEVPRTVGLLIYLACYFVLLRRIWIGRTGLYTAGFWAFFLYLLTSTSYRIWYPLWAIPLAVLAHTELQDGFSLARMRWRTYLLSLTSELSILFFTLLWRWVLNGALLPKADWFWMHLLVVPWQFGVPLLAPLLIRRPPPPPPLAPAPPPAPVILISQSPPQTAPAPPAPPAG
jgi:hypothetical protein